MLTMILPMFITMLSVVVPALLIVAAAASVPALTVVPMPLTFPSTPVLSHIIMCNPVVLRVHAAVSVGYVVHRTRHVSGTH
jgi:hypothetical protein